MQVKHGIPFECAASQNLQNLRSSFSSHIGGMVQTGLNFEDGMFADTPILDWQRKVQITLMTTVNATRAAIPQMKAQKHGRIIVRLRIRVSLDRFPLLESTINGPT